MSHGPKLQLLSPARFAGRLASPNAGKRSVQRRYNGAQVYMRKLLFPICGALFLLLTGCSEPTKTTEKKKEAEKLEPASGQSALYKMYQVARSWAPDAQVLKMNSLLLSEVPNVPPGTRLVLK